MKPNKGVKAFFDSPFAYVIAAFLVVLMLAWASQADAQEVTFETGPSINNVEDAVTIWIDTRWEDAAPGGADIAIGTFLTSEGTKVNGGQDVPRQMGVYGQFVVQAGDWDLGFGLAYQKNDDVVVSDPLRFNLHIARTFNWSDRGLTKLLPDRIGIRHLSNGGSGPINSGWDYVTFGWYIA
ncbi:MAG: hypothetical protein AAFR07_05555 [Pseudomonadota bacterium]